MFRWIADHQDTHRHKAQPKTGLKQSPRIKSHHHPQSQTKAPKSWPTRTPKSKQTQHPKHDDGPLRGQAPATEQRIQCGQQGTCQDSRMRRWPTQTKTASTRSRETPKSSHCAGHHPREQGNVQTRNTHQMRDTRGPEKIPIRSLNGGLVTHDQCRNHASHGPTLCISRQQFLFNFRSNILPSLCDRIKP